MSSQEPTKPIVSTRIPFKFKVEKIIDHTTNIRELYLQLVNNSTSSDGLKDSTTRPFAFKAGQFVMLHVPTDSKPALRAYSIASSDKQKDGFKLIFKFVENGIASKYVWSLIGNEELQFTGPFGKVFFQEPPTKQIVFLNTGSGISQHICFLLSKMHEYPDLHYKLYFGVRHETDIFYEDELKSIQKDLNNFEYHYVLSQPSTIWKGKSGYVQHHLKHLDYKNTPTTFYLCGNGGMIKEVKHQLIEVDGFDKSKIWTEAFD